MAEYSQYQKNVIKRYYDNRDQITEQRLSELVTSLYLAQGKKQANLWSRAEEAMRRLGIPESRIRHVVNSSDPAVLAEVVQDLQKGAITRNVPKSDSPK